MRGYLDQVLGIRKFDTYLAEKFGVNEALFLMQLGWLLKHDKPKEIDGTPWVSKTYTEWADIHPYWSESTIRRVIKSLEDQGVILSGEFNKFKQDRTKWYTVVADHPNTPQQMTTDHLVNVNSSTNKSDPVNLNSSHSVTLNKSHSGNLSSSHSVNKDSSYKKIKKNKENTKNNNHTAVGKPTVSEIMGKDIEEGELPEPDITSGTSLSLWYRRILKLYGHAKGVLPTHTIKQQGQLKFLLKKLGPDGAVQIQQALKHWTEFGKFVKDDYGKGVTNPKNLQKLLPMADALSEFEPPKEFVPTDTPEKTFEDTLSEIGKGPKAENPDLEL